MAGKPVIWLHAFEDTDPDLGVNMTFKEMIEKHFEVVTYQTLKDAPARGRDVQGVIFHSGKPFFDEQRHLMVNLKQISNFGVGYNHLDITALTREGVRVTNTPGVLDNATAELALTLMLTSSRRILEGVAREAGSINFMGQGLEGAMVGIVGMGNIGFKLAKLLQAFDARVLYHNRRRKSPEVESHVDARYCSSLVEMLPQCDHVVLTCPLTPETEHLFQLEQFRLMKKSATIVNIARGKVIHTQSLVEALTSEEIAHACLDVTDPEPLPREHPLRHLPNCLITPHIGSATVKARTAMMETVVLNLVAGLINKEPLPNQVQPQ